MNGRDYDYVRNTTLLFFLDRLMDKGQPRSLHDLSCQFGTKGFTKEMRQVAGGSQSGLRKFLSQYPSLFTLEDDKVYVTCYSNGPVNDSSGKNHAKQRDYAKEAVEYFVEKMEQYGNAEVPVKSLLGHRSQAPPEIRHVSGQHMKEFKDFLMQFPDVFIVKEEGILLAKFADETSRKTDDIIPKFEITNVLDTELTNHLISEFKIILENQGSMSADQIFHVLNQKFSKDKWSKVVKNVQDVITFLKMNSKTFLVASNIVSLVPQPASKDDRSLNNNMIRPSSLPSSPSKSGTIKQRVMSHVMKAVADNAAMEYKDRLCYEITQESPVHSPTRVLKSVKVITHPKECSSVVKLLSSSDPPVISLDGEGVNIGPNGPITLLQVSTWDGQIYIFDIQTCPELMTEGKLEYLLTSANIVKVMHDCRNDCAALQKQFNIYLKNVFDTQAAHCALQQQETGKPVYKVKNVSLNTLCKAYGGILNPKREQLKKIYRKDPKYWSRRPLTDDMILYAAYNVIALLPAVYQNMKSQLKPSFEQLFHDLCLEQVEACINSDEVKNRKKRRKLEMEVEDLKQKLSNSTSKNVVLSNREIRLLRYVELTEEEKTKLEGSYKVAKKLERLMNKNANGDGTEMQNDESGSFGSGEDPNNCSDDEQSTEGNGGFEDEDFADELHFEEDWTFEWLSEGNFPPSPNPTWLDSGMNISRKYGTLWQDGCCQCNCHANNNSTGSELNSTISSTTITQESSCQTLSTGDIVITKVFFDGNDNKNGDVNQNC